MQVPLSFLLLFVSLLPALFGSTPCARASVIRSFDVEVRLRQDTTIDVKETIIYDFQGAQRHGIDRFIPVRYDRMGGSYTLYLDVQSVTDEKGQSWRYAVTGMGRDVNIRIGDPDVTVSGVQTYRIQYQVRRAVNFFEGKPEIFWNATGNQWPVGMEQVTARFYPPPNVEVPGLPAKAFIGALGSKQEGQTLRNADHIQFTASNLNPSDGLTFVVGLPANSVKPPSALQIFLWWLADWWPLIFIPLAALTFVLVRWAGGGRDAGSLGAIPVEWNPPTNLSPAEVGTLVDEHCDMQDIVSTLIDLAARGYLIIQEIESENLLFLSKKDYLFIKQQPAHDIAKHPLMPHEHKFLQGLFGHSDRVTLSSLKERFYSHLPGIKSSIYQAMVSKKLFFSNPDTTRQAYQGIGITMLVFGVVGAIFGASFGLVAYGIGLALAGGIVWLSARAMPAKTQTGTLALRQCLGFQRFVRMAEKERIRVLAQDDPTIFGRMLPYAMVLGVADQWADAFKDLMTQPPDWYVGPYGYDGFSAHLFVHELGHGMNTMGSTFSSAPAPKSAAGSGGSGFSSGGGFSGGGFGGGGGGEW